MGRTTEGNLFQCAICLDRVSTRYGLFVHFLRRHAEADLSAADHSAVIAHCRKMDKTKKGKLFECASCLNRAPNRFGLFAHFLRRHADLSAADILVCDHCGHSTLNSWDLWKHIFDMHIGSLENERPTCNRCGKRFHWTKKLYHHIRVCQSVGSTKAFRCDDCGWTAEDKSNLAHHAVKSHLKLKFRCRFCDTVFSSRQAMGVHKRAKHSDALPYLCEICNKSVSAKYTIIKHLRFTHNF